MARVKGDYFKYGVFNCPFEVVEGFDTLKEAREAVKNWRETEEGEFRVVRLDDWGFIKKTLKG